MTVLVNGFTGKPVNVPEPLVERFLAVGFKRPTAKEPPRPASRRRRKSSTSDE